MGVDGQATPLLLQSALPASKLDVPIFATARGMLNREDHDFLCSLDCISHRKRRATDYGCADTRRSMQRRAWHAA
jgi:hypothetical protein